MAFNTITNLDFEDIKQSLKEYLRASELLVIIILKDLCLVSWLTYYPATLIIQH